MSRGEDVPQDRSLGAGVLTDVSGGHGGLGGGDRGGHSG